MRCVAIKDHGERLECLVLEERTDPEPGPEQIRVRVAATALNRADLLQRRGRYPPPADVPHETRDVPGLEFVGQVDRVGALADRWSVGDRVFGIVPSGGYSDQLVTYQDVVASVPPRLSDIEAAAIPEAYMTAYDALVLQARMRRGDRVLIHAVAGGVGTAALQLVHAWRAEPIGTTGSRAKIERVREVAPFFAINYREDDFREAVENEYGPTPVDVILDPVGAAYWDRNLSLLNEGGRLVVIGRMGGSDASLPLATLMSKRLRIMGSVLRARSRIEKADLTRRFVEEVLPRLHSGELRGVIDSVYPLEEVRAATARMENNENVGKIVLTLA